MIPIRTKQLTIELKRTIVQQFITQKTAQLEAFENDQKQRLQSSNQATSDNRDLTESPREQVVGEIDMKAGVLDQMRTDLDMLRTLPLQAPHHSVALGSLVRTNHGDFLVAVAHTSRPSDALQLMGVSAASPIFSKMEGLRVGDGFQLKDRRYGIEGLV